VITDFKDGLFKSEFPPFRIANGKGTEVPQETASKVPLQCANGLKVKDAKETTRTIPFQRANRSKA
jgi:hypothetical protein